MTYWKSRHSFTSFCASALLASTSLLPFAFTIAVLISESSVASILARLSDDVVVASLTFTVSQAFLTAIIVAIASPFCALGLFLVPKSYQTYSSTLRTASFCMPSIVIASGLVLAWGRAGIVSQTLTSWGVSHPVTDVIYSRYAIVFANALMNVPFCSVIIFRRLLEIPELQYKAASMLGLRPIQIFKALLWPVIKPVTVYFAGLSFLLSMGSFGALSVLGSGPQSETIELAIYQAVYYDGDWTMGGVLSILHTLLCGVFAYLIVASRSSSPLKDGSAVDVSFRFVFLKKILLSSRSTALTMTALSVLLDLLTLSPLVAVLTHALGFKWQNSLDERWAGIGSAALTSAMFAIPAAALTTFTAWAVVRSLSRYLQEKRYRAATGLQLVALSSIIVPPMALAFGIMVLQSSSDFAISQSFMITPALSAITLPFAMSVLLPAYESRLSATNQTRLIIGLPESIFIKKVEWRSLKLPLATVFSISAALCLNETSLVTMLGDPSAPALTTAMMRLMNQYRFTESAIVACILMVTTIFIVYYFYKSEGLDHD